MKMFRGGGLRAPSVYFTAGFRPFFLAAAIWAVVGVTFWIFLLTTGTALPSRFDPRAWHIHEMLFGFAMAAVSGFLLTAIANWTQRPPVQGLLLAILASLWLLGRLACLVSALLPGSLAIVLDLSFPSLLTLVVAREIKLARNWCNLPMLVPLMVLGGANLLMHLEAAGRSVTPGLAWRLAIAAMVVLISVVGGRIIPSFTRNWLAAQGCAGLLPSPAWVNRAALGSLHAGLVSWVVFPRSGWAGAVLGVGAALNGWRLRYWYSNAIIKEPLLLVLHVGYAWLVLGAALLGLATLCPAMPQSAAVHALTAGAMGTMILAVMTRATRGHTGYALKADRATSGMFILINLAAAVRVFAGLGIAWVSQMIQLSALLWVLAFALFVLRYGPILVQPRVAGQAG